MMSKDALRPHHFTMNRTDGCRWCGMVYDHIIDGLASVECASHNPVERALLELSEELQRGITLASIEVRDFIAQAQRAEDRIGILKEHLSAVMTQLEG